MACGLDPAERRLGDSQSSRGESILTAIRPHDVGRQRRLGTIFDVRDKVAINPDKKSAVQ